MGLYSEANWEDKHKTWTALCDLHASVQLPWVVMGIYNEILYSHEKEGGRQRQLRLMQNYRDAFTDCSLEDMGYMGDAVT